VFILFSCVCEHLGYHTMLQSLILISDHKNHSRYQAPDSAIWVVKQHGLIVTIVLGQPISPIFKGQAVLKMGQICCPKISLTNKPHCITSQENESLIPDSSLFKMARVIHLMDGNMQSVLFISKLMHTDCLNSSLLQRLHLLQIAIAHRLQ
jgi:hypothetical protein